MKKINEIKYRLLIWLRSGSASIWGKYAKWIMTIAAVMIVAINWSICSVVRQESKKRIQGNITEIVESQARCIDGIFQTDMQAIRHLFDGCTIDKMDQYLKRADRFVNEHPDDYDGYARITWRDGRSYTSDKGLDPRNFATYDIPRMIFYENVPYVITSPYKTMDKVEVRHYGIHFPLYQNDSVIAVITTTIPQEAIDEPISKMRINGQGVPCIIHSREMAVIFEESSDGKVLMRGQQEQMGLLGLDKVLDDSEKTKGTGKCHIGTFTSKASGKAEEATAYICYGHDSDWAIALAIKNANQDRSINTLLAIIIVLSLATILALYLALKYITRRVVLKPISQANSFAKEFAEGKLFSNEIDNIDSNNEFGEMKQCMAGMRGKLADVLNSIKTRADEISLGSERVISLVNQLEDGAQTQAASTEEISASIENISASIKQINDNAQGATVLSNEVASGISRMAEFSKTTLETIKNVINKIKIINDIAQRTDLLAINASAEAARSRKSGEGFTQVAAEIRKLAEMCQQASSEINATSAQSLKVTEHAASLISSMEPKVKDNAQMVAEISDSCVSQLKLTRLMADPIQQLVTITSNNSNNAEELSGYVDSLRDTCRKLVESVEFFKFESDKDSQEEILAQISECSSEIMRLRLLLSRQDNQQ